MLSGQGSLPPVVTIASTSIHPKTIQDLGVKSHFELVILQPT